MPRSERLLKLLRWLGRPSVLAIISLLGVTYMIVWLLNTTTANRTLIDQNRTLIQQQRAVDQRSLNTLRYTCSALNEADVFVVQLVAERMRIEKTLSGAELERSQNLTSTLNVLHNSLNDRRACNEVSG